MPPSAASASPNPTPAPPRVEDARAPNEVTTEPSDDAARLRARDLDDLTLPFGLRRPRAVFTSLDAAQDAGHDATLHTSVTVALLTVLGGWTTATGALPAMHPQHGPLLLALHMGAWMTGWLGLHAAGASASTASPARLRWICRAALLVNTAMVMGAVLR